MVGVTYKINAKISKGILGETQTEWEGESEGGGKKRGRGIVHWWIIGKQGGGGENAVHMVLKQAVPCGHLSGSPERY